MPTVSMVPRVSLKNILIPTDFSPAARAAFPFARALAQTYGSTILVAHAVTSGLHRQIVADHVPDEDALGWQDARLKLQGFQHDPGLAGISCKTLLGCGNVGEVIPDMIEAHKVDLVVLGTRGRRGVSKIILGSEAEKIYRAAPCPVLLIGPKAESASAWKLRRMLCPIDTAGDPAPALHYALSLAQEHQAKFILMQTIPLVPWQHQEDVERQSRRALEALIPGPCQDWCSPECVVRWEYPPEAILLEAEERQVDLIVMSVHRSRANSWSHLPCPVAAEVISQARSPVLTIRV